MLRVMLRLSLVGMLTVVVSACAVQGLPPLARAVGAEALAGQSPTTPLVAGGAGLGLGAGIVATMRRRRRRRGAAPAAAGWSVLADVPDQHDAAFSLAPVVEDPPAPHVDAESDAPDRDGHGVDDDPDTSWLGELAEPDDDAPLPQGPRPEPEADDDAALPASPSAERTSPDTPWWAGETSANQAVDEPDPDDAGAADTTHRAPQADRPFDSSERR